jgi:16S rRNA (uracil1498-N3)-methyltransferase
MIPRFHCPTLLPEALHAGERIELPAAAAHHALHVLRMQSGDALVLFTGQGGAWQARLALEKVGAGRTAGAILEAFDADDCETPLAITLVQALPSGDKMDWIVEKAVELGVAAIQPVAAKRCVVKLNAERRARRQAHWNQVASAACAQCGRNRVPWVAAVLDLPQYLAQAKAQNALRLLLAPASAASWRILEQPMLPVVVMIGPEGGWDASELSAAQAAGFTPVQLGPRVLRTETAGLAALAAMQAVWGDFQV